MLQMIMPCCLIHSSSYIFPTSVKCQISASTSYRPAVNGKIYGDLRLVHPLTRPVLQLPRGATFPRVQGEAGVFSMDCKVSIS